MHVTMGLFEMHQTSGKNMAIQLESLFSMFGLMHCVIIFVKHDSSNLTKKEFALCSII